MATTSNLQFEHEKWSSEAVFLLAAIGGAVGLGNLWRFPFIAGQNGGGAFVLIYIGFVFLLCLPLVIAELAMGRRGRGSAAQAQAAHGSGYGAPGSCPGPPDAGGAGSAWRPADTPGAGTSREPLMEVEGLDSRGRLWPDSSI